MAALAGVGLIPAATAPLGPTSVGVSAGLGGGRTIVTVPPLGTVSASTHTAPVDLDLTFRTIDFEELGPLATTPSGRRQLLAMMQDDLERLVRRGSLQLLGGGALTAAVAAALLWHRRWGRVAVAGASGAIVIAALLAITASTFDARAFEQPRYSGTLARAPVVIEALRETPAVLDDLRSRYEVASRRLSELLVLVARPDTDPRTDALAILHIGDIHANPIGLEIADELATEFQVDAVIDTGDLASSTLDTGSLSSLSGPIDRRLADLIENLDVPYLFVRGNHDPPHLLRRLALTPNVTVLEGEPIDILGMTILGWPDPTFTTDSSVSQEAKEEERLDLAPAVAEAVAAQFPDLLVVHDERLASHSIGLVDFVLAGHRHERGMEQRDGTMILTVGSTGATGLKSLTLEADKSYEAEVLYLRTGDVIAVDYITFRGANDFEVERTTLDDLEEEDAED